MACGHEADSMRASQFALGIDQLARLQLSVFDLFPNGVLDSPIRGKGVSINVGTPHNSRIHGLIRFSRRTHPKMNVRYVLSAYGEWLQYAGQSDRVPERR